MALLPLPRIRQRHAAEESAMRACLRHALLPLPFSDEGDGINGTANRTLYMRAVERFLARHLGGRDGGEGQD